MPGSLSLTIGTNAVTIPIKGTNIQINAGVRRYAIQKGIQVEGRTATQIGEDVVRSLLRTMRDGSIDRQRSEGVAAHLATLEATIAAENDFVDEP